MPQMEISFRNLRHCQTYVRGCGASVCLLSSLLGCSHFGPVDEASGADTRRGYLGKIALVNLTPRGSLMKRPFDRRVFAFWASGSIELPHYSPAASMPPNAKPFRKSLYVRIDPRSVYRWIERYRTNATLEGLRQQPGQGRPLLWDKWLEERLPAMSKAFGAQTTFTDRIHLRFSEHQFRRALLAALSRWDASSGLRPIVRGRAPIPSPVQPAQPFLRGAPPRLLAVLQPEKMPPPPPSGPPRAQVVPPQPVKMPGLGRASEGSKRPLIRTTQTRIE
jgi:hypothetical protein